MSENEKLKINLQLFASSDPGAGGGTGGTTSGGDTTPDTPNDEDMTLEDEKKAINLKDLIYIKKYIDDNHYDIPETDAMLQDAALNAVKNATYTKDEINANHYTKTEIDKKHYTKTEIDNNHYTKAQADNTFYSKTQTVDRAFLAERIAFTTVAPTASPAAGSMIICFLSEEPATRYDRVIYLIGG